MPTVIHFVGAEPSVTLEEDYDKVTTALHGGEDVGHFTHRNGRRVTIYKSGIAYIEEASEAKRYAH
jgi:hypothetical protein